MNSHIYLWLYWFVWLDEINVSFVFMPTPLPFLPCGTPLSSIVLKTGPDWLLPLWTGLNLSGYIRNWKFRKTSKNQKLAVRPKQVGTGLIKLVQKLTGMKEKQHTGGHGIWFTDHPQLHAARLPPASPWPACTATNFSTMRSDPWSTATVFALCWVFFFFFSSDPVEELLIGKNNLSFFSVKWKLSHLLLFF